MAQLRTPLYKHKRPTIFYFARLTLVTSAPRTRYGGKFTLINFINSAWKPNLISKAPGLEYSLEFPNSMRSCQT